MGILAHQHEAKSINDFALPVSRYSSTANLVTNLYIGNVTDSNWRTVHGFDDDVFDLRNVYGTSNSVHQ